MKIHIALYLCLRNVVLKADSRPSAATPSIAPYAAVPSPATQPLSTVTPPNCKKVGQGIYPAKYCNQYYECLERGLIIRRYKRVLRTCPDDLIFDVSSETCAVGTCNPKSVAPDCRTRREGRFPAESCREFYECSPFFWPRFPPKDYDLILKACKPDEVFDANKQKCVKGACKQ
nr:unnamed protein product [Callosobruchus analis]